MKKYFLIACLALASLSVSAQVLGTAGGQVVAPVIANASSYIGPVATATNIPNNLYTTAGSSAMTRKGHYMRAGTTRLKLVYPNWRVDTLDNNVLGAESGTGNAITVSAWVEYPVGTYTQITFGGASSASILDLTTQASDFLSISIPQGAVFYTWTHVASASGNAMPYFYTATETVLSSTMGEKADFNTGGVPATPGAMTDNGSYARGYWPTAILGDNQQPSWCLIGDSRTAGAYEFATPSLDIGNLARSIGPTNAYLNMAVSGDRMASFFTSSKLRTALINSSGCTNIIDELGVNENYQQSAPAANWEAIQANLTARFNGRKYARTTMEPATYSTDSWATAANQSATGYNSNITTENDWVRASADGTPYVELSTPVSSALDSGLWAANNYASTFTNGGIHESTRGSIAIVAAQTIKPETLSKLSPISVSYPSIALTGSTLTYATGYFSGYQAATLAQYQYPSEAPLDVGAPPVTIEGWVYITSCAGANEGPFSFQGSGNYNIGITFAAGTCYIGFHLPNGSNVVGTTAFPVNGWHHLRMTVASQSFAGNLYYTIYLDGVQAAQTSVSTTSTQFGNQYGVSIGSQYFVGQVEEVALWDTLLNTGSFTPPAAPYVGTETGLMGLWHLNGNLAGIRGPDGY